MLLGYYAVEQGQAARPETTTEAERVLGSPDFDYSFDHRAREPALFNSPSTPIARMRSSYQ
jgi:hypothetical protein